MTERIFRADFDAPSLPSLIMPNESPTPAVVPVNSTTSAHRIEGLDALRGIAALGVVLVHFMNDFTRHTNRSYVFAWTYGGYGVYLFFLISGFVIFMTVTRARRPIDFVISRFSRLYPPYWVAIALSTAILLCFPIPGSLEPASVLKRAVVDLTMFQYWFKIGSIDGVYWTLQVEMSFYLVMLALIWFKATSRILSVMTVWLLLGLLDHLFLNLSTTENSTYRYIRQILIFEYVYLFTAGIVVFHARQGWKFSHVAILLLCAVSPMTARYFPNNPVQDTAVYATFTAIIYLATTGRLRFLVNPVLLFLGRISYSLYLTHFWVGVACLLMLNRWHIPVYWELVIGVAVCLVVATLVNSLVERPGSAWVRNRLQRLFPMPEPRGGSISVPEVANPLGVSV